MNRILSASSLLFLLLLTACGGGGGGSAPAPTPVPTPTWATSLAYTDPPAAGFRLVKNTSLSTPSRLVLDLTGPSGQNAQGLSFILAADATKVQWTTPPSASGLVQSLAFSLGTSTPALVGKDMGGGILQGAAFQKAGSQPLGQPLLRVCLDLKPGAVAVNASVSLLCTGGNLLSDTGSVASLTAATGTCVAQ